MAFAALTIDLNARLAKFEQDMARAGKGIDGLNSKVSSAAAGFKSAFGALGVTLGVGALASFAKSGIDAADALGKMSLRTGVAVKDLASFQLAAESADTSMEGVAKGLGKLNRSIGEAEAGNKLIADSLKQLGITAKDPKEAFYQLADATERIQDPTKRAYLLNNVLGKSYEELVPLLVQGGDALRQSAEASETFAESMARLAPDAEKFNDSLTAMKINAAGAAAAILAELVPAMNEVFERISLVKDLIGAGGWFNTIVNTAGTSDISEVMQRIRSEIELTQQAIDGKRASGRDSSAFEEKLKGLNAQLQVLIENRVKAGMVPPQTETLKLIKQDRAGSIGRIASGGSKSAGGSQADPLASLLASTDIGKLAAFDKQVALLNARFDGGRKNAELYAQAMTKLVESTFSSNFSDYAKQLAEQDETQRLLADHLAATNDALYAQSQAWTEAGRALEDEMRTPLENANIEFARLQDMLDRGVISWETYTRAVFKTSEAIATVPEKLEEMDTFAKTAAKNIQNSFADFLFDPFENGLKGMAQSFGQLIQKMIAEAVAADLAKKLFGDAGTGGFLGPALSGFGKLLGFENGGIMTSAGPMPLHAYASGGIASTPQLALFGEGRMNEAYVPLPDGRSIPVKMQGGGGHTINVYVNGTSAPDVRRAAGQGAREALGMLNGARRYG